MNKLIKWSIALLTGGIILAVAAGIVAFSFTSNASAKTTSALHTNIGVMNFRGGPGFPGGKSDEEEALANALGISVETLQSAQQKASDAAIQQAVDKGLITQDQADAMILRGYRFDFGHGFEGHGVFGANSGINYDELLADALGISVDKLKAARQQAESDLLAQAVANGTITQEQADMIKARQALQSYLDPNTLLAQALGISTEQLQTYRDQGMSLSQILAKVGKTAIEVRDAEQAAYQAAVAKAVSDGVITQSQADQFLAGGFRGLEGFGCGPEFGGFGRGRHGGFGKFDGGFYQAPKLNPETTPSATPGSGL